MLNGLALAFAWTGAVAGFARARRALRGGTLDEAAIGAGLGAHLALALLHVLVVEAPPEAVAAGEGSALGARRRRRDRRRVLRLRRAARPPAGLARPPRRVGLAAVAYLAAIDLDGAALVAAWAAEAAALAELARRAKAARRCEGPLATRAARGRGARRLAPARSSRDRMGAEWVAGAAVPFQLGPRAGRRVRADRAGVRRSSAAPDDVRAAVVALRRGRRRRLLRGRGRAGRSGARR